MEAHELAAAFPAADSQDRLHDALNLLSSMSEGAVVVDQEGRITWINLKYCRLLGLTDTTAAIGRPVEEVIPESKMRQVVGSGRPIMLDLMRFGERHFVVCRLPIKDGAGRVDGAVGFVFFDRVDALRPILDRFLALEAQLDKAQNALARERRARYSLSNFVGLSHEILELKAKARRFALREGPVLILGETGVGKELLAQAIHLASQRTNGPFVAVNMAAVPETLLESEFFGVTPGAFTGAERRARPGKFEIADRGTLFLDEVGDMPLAIQAKFLRVLQEGEIEALGSNQLKRVDVRIIAATSQDLEAKVKSGEFRADLYYRLAVLPLSVIPLRSRLQDIPALAERILDEVPKEPGFGNWFLSEDALDLLRLHSWPGNVRELRNVLERATALADSEALDADIIRSGLNFAPGATEDIADAGSPLLADVVARAEQNAISRAVALAGGDKTKAAKLLGVSRSQLYAKLKAFGAE
jgi:transcriptional regulator with PAS, ATPase and Fis domain